MKRQIATETPKKGTNIKTNMKLRIVAVLIGTGVAAWGQSLPIIDDFTTGTYQTPPLKTGVDSHFQTGKMIGGARSTYFSVGPNTLQQTATLSFLSQGMLTVETGAKLFHRLDMSYGVDPVTGLSKPLGLDLTAYDRFRVHFDTNDLLLNLIILVHFNNNSTYEELGYQITPGPSNRGFDQDFKFADFNIGSGADWHHVDYITVIVYTGSPVGANNYAIQNITVRYGI